MIGRRGFTIIELLITITLISLIIAAAALSINHAIESAHDARRVGDVLLIAKAIDQSALINRGVYPENPSGPTAQVCANQLANSLTNPSHLDLSLFPNHQIPVDPNPAITSSTCTSYANGYTYSTTIIQNSSNIAVALQVYYTLEVGLENDNFQDESLLKNDSAFGTPLPAPNPQAASRTRYVLTGPYCGSNCPAR